MLQKLSVFTFVLLFLGFTNVTAFGSDIISCDSFESCPVIKAPTLNWLGEWDYGFEYKIGDTIHAEGSTYIAVADHLAEWPNYPPSQSWNIVARRGTSGYNGPAGPAGPKGDLGEQGVPGLHGLEGRMCPDYVRGFDADGNLICGTDTP